MSGQNALVFSHQFSRVEVIGEKLVEPRSHLTALLLGERQKILNRPNQSVRIIRIERYTSAGLGCKVGGFALQAIENGSRGGECGEQF